MTLFRNESLSSHDSVWFLRRLREGSSLGIRNHFPSNAKNALVGILAIKVMVEQVTHIDRVYKVLQDFRSAGACAIRRALAAEGSLPECDRSTLAT